MHKIIQNQQQPINIKIFIIESQIILFFQPSSCQREHFVEYRRLPWNMKNAHTSTKHSHLSYNKRNIATIVLASFLDNFQFASSFSTISTLRACPNSCPSRGFPPSNPCVCAFRIRPDTASSSSRKDRRARFANDRRRIAGKLDRRCSNANRP